MLDVSRDRLLLLRIEGMHCHRCEQSISRSLMAQPGVHEVEVDFPSAQASVLVDGSLAEIVDRCVEIVSGCGYRVEGATLVASVPVH